MQKFQYYTPMRKSELSKLLLAGGGITIDAERFYFGELKALARAAANGNAILVISNPTGYSCDELALLSREGKGHVRFSNIQFED